MEIKNFWTFLSLISDNRRIALPCQHIFRYMNKKIKKYLSFAAIAATMVASCSHPVENQNDKKIKESIAAYLSAGIAKKDMPKIDSIAINSVDTLTQKNILKISLDRNYNTLRDLNAIYGSKVQLIEADSSLLRALQMQQAMYDKHNEKHDDASLRQQITKMKTDSTELAESLVNVQKTKNSIDSITKLYATADSVAFAAYYIGASIYLNGGTTDQGNYIISKDWKVSR